METEWRDNKEVWISLVERRKKKKETLVTSDCNPTPLSSFTSTFSFSNLYNHLTDPIS